MAGLDARDGRPLTRLRQGPHRPDLVCITSTHRE
jgi:hypothetical protein